MDRVTVCRPEPARYDRTSLDVRNSAITQAALVVEHVTPFREVVRDYAHQLGLALDHFDSAGRSWCSVRAGRPATKFQQGPLQKRKIARSVVWEASMSIKQELKDTSEKLRLLSLYQRFEHVVIMFLTALIAIIVIAAIWNLSLKILFGLLLSGTLAPSDCSAVKAVFGMIFTVIIALEFKKSLLVVAERRETVVQIRSVVMIALLAICRTVIILALNT